MYWIIGIISILGILTGIYSILKYNKANGIIRVVLAVVCSIITVWFSSLKESYVFGGSDWEFMVQSAIVDGDIYPWLLLILLVVEVFLIVKTTLKLYESKKI